MAKTTYKIAVVGAGPAGCTLAHLLRKANMDVVVFESDSSPQSRSQGGSLDLHTNSGLAALKEIGLLAEFEKYARYDGEALAVADKHNNRYVSLKGSTSRKDSRGRPEIDRTRLREILAKPLSELGIVQWGHRIIKITADGTLHFTSGTAGGFNLVVGADGAWSKVRKMLTNEPPVYIGIGGLEGRIPNAALERPWIHRLTSRGSWIGLGDGRGLACQQQGDDSITVSLWRKASEDEIESYDVNDASAIKDSLHREYHD